MPGFPCKIGDLGETLYAWLPPSGGLGRYVLNPKPNPETKPPPYAKPQPYEPGGGGRVGREGLSQHKHAYIQKHGEASVLECAIQFFDDP